MVKSGLKEAAIGAVGDVVRLKDGSTQCVDDIEIVELPEGEYVAVYNFEVADFHTYFVSDYDVLVHNKCKVNANNSDKIKNNVSTLQNGIPENPDTVRRFVSKSEFKSFKKNGFHYNPKDSRGGISTTSLIKPVNPDAIKKHTGALGADYFIDINTKNKKVSLKGKTKYGLPDWKIKSNVFWSDVITWKGEKINEYQNIFG